MPPPSSAPIRTAAEAAAWLESLINVEKRPDWPYRRFSLDAVRALLERLGRPERGLSVLHIAGSKGKGSVALLSEALLGALGLCAGTFTSPHLERWTERFRIAGAEVQGGALAAAVERVRPHVEALRAEDPERAPTFFDATTAVALLLFREAGVDHAILEVGLGGRLDSTNACEPRVTCVTSIELEHTDRLGGTLALIAAEKAGILKPGVPVVVGALPEEALRVVEARAAELGAPLVRLGRELQVEVEREADAARVAVRDGSLAVRFELPLLGAAAPLNAALAIACVRRLLGEGEAAETALAAAIAPAFRDVHLPARIEVLCRDPWLLVDAAHTVASARALAEVLQQLGRPVELVLSVSSDKDVTGLLAALLPGAQRVTLTRAEPTRSLDPLDVARVARGLAPEADLRVVPNPHLAVRGARDALLPGAVLCVAGSVYLAGIARRVLADPAGAARAGVTRRK